MSEPGTRSGPSASGGTHADLTAAEARRVVVVCGPTAVGKGTVVAAVRAQRPEIYFSVSATTRAPRPGEIDGVHYRFVTDAEFDRLVAADGLLEWAIVHGRSRYGTPRAPVVQAVRSGRIALLELDVQGARQVRARCPGSRLVFLAPPSWEEMVRRLLRRGTETAEEQQRRLATARGELAAESEFDVVIVNDEVGQAVADLLEWLGQASVDR